MAGKRGALARLDLSLELTPAEEQARLVAAQERLLQLRLVLGGLIGSDPRIGPPVCVVFEGWDASGKGGAIKRLVTPLDPRHVRVAQFGAPSYDEKRHHFLWRFWPVLPGWGGMAVLDRSWYGRVLVERVEGFATEQQWRRAYGEIVEFEQTLAAEGMIMIKFWLHLSSAEQLRRFKAREQDPLKTWKLTAEDWRNRGKRRLYKAAVEDMLDRTDHEAAPWVLIEAEERHAPGSVRRIQAFFRRFGYRGYFVFHHQLAPIECFDPARMQRSEDIADYTLGVPRARFERYINNFLFLPGEEPSTTLPQLEAALTKRAGLAGGGNQ